MNKEAFFKSVRESLFSGKLNQEQVDGMEAILKVGNNLSVDHIAYVLATAYHETMKSMSPNRENMNYSDASRIIEVFGKKRLAGNDPSTLVKNPEKLANVVYGGAWGKKNLGNTEVGDGYRYRGGGMDHVTGRANYRKAGREVGVDLLKEPDKLLDPEIAARVIVSGMVKGRYRGHKLSDFTDFHNMRDIINGDKRVNGPRVSQYAVKFKNALLFSGWGKEEKTSLLATILKRLMEILK